MMNNDLNIRTDIRPGDLGYITYLHGQLYGKEYGYNFVYERYVAQGLGELMENYDAERDHVWLVEDQGQIVGSVAIMGRSGKVAQLRYFLLLDAYRGKGLGSKLLQMALDFCKEAGYLHVYLMTATELKTAAHLYQKFGFTKTREIISHHWGKEVVEAYYDLELSKM